jgi:hypothetical protein
MRIEPSTKRLSERAARLCAGRLRCCLARLGEEHPSPLGPGRVSVRIVDVRPLQTSDPGLRDLITHTFGVRDQPLEAAPLSAGRNRARQPSRRRPLTPLPRWRLARRQIRAVTRHLHTLLQSRHALDRGRAEQRRWQQPLSRNLVGAGHPPCPARAPLWQTGWHGTAETGTPRFTCKRHAPPTAAAREPARRVQGLFPADPSFTTAFRPGVNETRTKGGSDRRIPDRMCRPDRD